MAYEEKELVYNLYPLQVGWQELPVLSLEYNTKADPQKNDSQNALLDELVQRALPKRDEGFFDGLDPQTIDHNHL